MTESQAKYLTVEEVADMLRVHRRTVQRRIRAGHIPAVKIGRRWFIPQHELEEVLETGTSKRKNEMSYQQYDILQQFSQVFVSQMLPLIEESVTPPWETVSRRIAAQMEQLAALPLERMGRYFSEQIIEDMDRLFQPMLQPVQDAIEQVALSAQRYIDEAEVDAQTLKPIFYDAGFWLTPSMPSRLLRTLRQRHHEEGLDASTLKQVILQVYQEDKCEILRRTVDGWKSISWFKSRMNIIHDALDAHVEGKYTLSIPTLLAQVEGIAGDIIGDYSGRTFRKVKKAAVNQSPDILQAVTKAALLRYITTVGYKPFSDLSDINNWLKQQHLIGRSVLHRTAILHGLQVDYASEENSLRAFLILDALTWGVRSDKVE